MDLNALYVQGCKITRTKRPIKNFCDKNSLECFDRALVMWQFHFLRIGLEVLAYLSVVYYR